MSSRSVLLFHALPRPSSSFFTSDMHYTEAALVSLQQSFLKKCQPVGNRNRVADAAALELFLECNEKCSSWFPDESSYYYELALKAREIFNTSIFSGYLQEPIVSVSNAINHIRPGPGASIGTNFTDIYGKLFDSQLTTYDECTYKLYVQSVGSTWSLAEKVREHTFGHKVEACSKLNFAKKNSDISRVINTEASIDMLFQLGLGECLNEVLRQSHNICVTRQPKINRLLAKLGSIDGSNATIDEKSASDLVSAKFVEWFADPRVFMCLDRFRSKMIELPKTHGGAEIPLHIFSTMGNGFTFPLQTLIFASLVKAVYQDMGLPTNCFEYPHYSVFGDDIVVSGVAFEKVIKLLEWCGFRTNYDKSYNAGSFRESCGQDFFKGHNIRGVYLRQEPKHDHQVFSLFNRLTRFGIRNRIDLSVVLKELYRLAKRKLHVPFDLSDNAGFKVPAYLSGRGELGRYKHLSPVNRKRAIIPNNSNGLLVAVLYGGITSSLKRNGSKDRAIKPLPNDPSLRTSERLFATLRAPESGPRYKVKRGRTSSWDFVPHHGMTSVDYLYALRDVVETV